MSAKKTEKTTFDTLAPGDETLDYTNLDYSTLDWDRLTTSAIEIDPGDEE